MEKHSTLSINTSEYAGAEEQHRMLMASPFVSSSSHVMRPTGRPSVRDSIGIVRLCILGLGAAAIIIATTVLALLWQGAASAMAQAKPGQTWWYVMDTGLTPVMVTVCAAMLRTAISLQAGVAVSMVASILLESKFVQLEDSIFLSTVRAVSIQPANLMIFGGRSMLRSLGPMGFPLLVIAGLVAAASTFTSSILLSDFGSINILGNSQISMVGYGNDSAKTATDIWRSSPVQFARFAEYTDSGSAATGQHIDDTGITLRAPLPMAASGARETLREYTGPATVFDHRVICVAPQELTISSFNATRTLSSNPVVFMSFGGYATFDTDLPPPLLGAKPGTQVPFNCLTPSNTQTVRIWSNITVCVVRPPASTESNPSSPLRLTPFLPMNANLTIFGPPIYFIIKVTPPERGNSEYPWSDFASEHFDKYIDDITGVDIPPSALSTTREGPWTTTRVEGVEFLEGVTFSASACVSLRQGFAFNVTFTSASQAPEPVLGWSGTLRSVSSNSSSTSAFTYDTAAVRRQLNSTADSAMLSVQQRGVMQLDFSATNWSRPLDADPSFFLDPYETFPILQTVPLCPRTCRTDPSAVMAVDEDSSVGHPVHVALFHDALAETGSPALALQSWLTTLTRQRFYDGLGRFTTGAEARHAHSVQVFAPQRWAGFAGVVAMVACHFVIMAAVTAWYLRVARHTMLGNSWQAASQVVSDATLPLLQRATSLKDSEVKTIIRREISQAEAKEGSKYGIVRLRKTGRRELAAIYPS